MQQLYNGLDNLNNIIESNGLKSILLVCGQRVLETRFVADALKSLKAKYKAFTNFTPNPKLEEAKLCLEYFANEKFDAIIAIGGGSSMDVAKYIKLQTALPLIAVPTTAGSGSEATKYAVIYDNGEKQSITSEDIIPEFVVFESKFLETLPEYQKKCTVLDALCHSIESYWSINSTTESQKIAKEAIQLILANYKDYVNNDRNVFNDIMFAANLAGKAINITQTTAGHAFSYKITSIFDIPHGHAVAVCLSKVWAFLNDNICLCSDPRGEVYLSKTLCELENIISLDKFNNILNYFGLKAPKISEQSQIDLLVKSVNVQRLKNFPIKLSDKDVEEIYRNIGCR
ncbi:MAG: phosphonoacetaldehyde reductase [Clostridia bacterium]|nr:phosphonoacetaldehyde reductase [Clostridia bacterium]